MQSNKKKIIKKIGVIYGGKSAEREVSLRTGAAIADALSGSNYDVVLMDAGRPDFLKKLVLSRIDLAFIALHGGHGEDGTIQGVFEFLGIPYTGSGVLASAIAMDKIFTKKILEFHGIKTPPWRVLRRGDELAGIWLPAVVKPARQGSAIGISIVKKKSEIRRALSIAFKFGDEVLVEKYIKGKEITVAVLADVPLTPVQIVPKNSFYDYFSKYAKGGSAHIIPPELDKNIVEKAKRIGLSVHSALGCKSVSRVDMIVDGRGGIFVLEVNTVPGMTATSLYPDAAKHDGIKFKEMIEKIIFSSVK